MELEKRIYLIILYILLFILGGCFIESVGKKSKIARAILGIVVVVFLSIFSFALSICIHNLVWVKILYIFYNIMLDVSMFAALNLELALEEHKRTDKVKKQPRNLKFVSSEEQGFLAKRIAKFSNKFSIDERFIFITYAALSILDFILISVFTFGFFDIHPVMRKNHFYCWRVIPHKQIIFHLSVCYSFAAFVAVKYIRSILKSSKFNRPKYIVVLTLFSIVIIINAIYVSDFFRWRVDYSMFGYGIITIITFTFSMYVIPKKVQQHMLSIATETISDAVICFDEKLRCLYKNRSALELYDENYDDTGQYWKHCVWMEKYFNSPETHVNRTESIKVNGELRIYQLEFHRFQNSKGKLSGCYFKLNDKTIEVQNLEKETYRATHDELTGLYNRNQFFKEAEKILKETPDVPRYLVSTNIKNFKLVNDLFGSKFGDEVLRYQAKMLCNANYDGTIFGRISGDKFAMLINKCNFNPEYAAMNTNSIKTISHDVNYQMEIKIGVYEIANAYESVVTMYDKANLAIKNCEDHTKLIVMYDTSLMEKLRYEKYITSDFKYSLQNNNFFMFLQSQVDSKTEKVIGAEALVRWYDINNGYRQPGDFIHILEKSGLIYQLDHYIWEKAVQTLSKWKKEGFEDYYISVNISVRDFYYADLYHEFVNLVEKYDVSPSKLNLEITESVLMNERNVHEVILTKLQEYGFKIEMDDFGSGYSSLNVLKNISMDVLKIDMGFLRHSENESRGELIINLISKMARNLGMTVVCEGVETEHQKELLQKAGVDVFQGYLYSKPVSLAEFEKKYLGGTK